MSWIVISICSVLIMLYQLAKYALMKNHFNTLQAGEGELYEYNPGAKSQPLNRVVWLGENGDLCDLTLTPETRHRYTTEQQQQHPVKLCLLGGLSIDLLNTFQGPRPRSGIGCADLNDDRITSLSLCCSTTAHLPAPYCMLSLLIALFHRLS